MITSIKDLIGFFLQKIDVQKLDKSEGNKKMAIRKSAIEKFFEKLILKNLVFFIKKKSNLLVED